jgi:hypothetical protein
MRIVRYVLCLLDGGHRWVNSHSKPGYQTCARCRVRRPKHRTVEPPTEHPDQDTERH